VISYQFLHLTIIQGYSKLSLLSCCKKNTGLFGNFSQKGGGSPIPKTLSKFTNMVLEIFPLIHFFEEQKCSLGSKMQNKHKNFFG